MSDKPPILFLDLDGVLNRWSSFDWTEEPKALLERECVKSLNLIIEQTAAEIVISSSWRHYVLGGHMTIRGFEHMLRSHGVRGSVIGTTCGDDCHDERGEQIRHWRRDNPGRRYVILDDCRHDFAELGLKFVRTHGSYGLTETDAHKAILILKGEF